MGWGSVARDNVQVEGVELIRCVNGCVAIVLERDLRMQ